MKRLLVDPLFHFLLTGALIFGVYGLVAEEGPGDKPTITVSQARIDVLLSSFERSWRRPPTQSEIDGLIEDHVREEIAVREAVRMGLDLDDSVIRRLLRRKFEFVAADVIARVEPAESELKAYFAANADQFRGHSRFTFRHVYFNPQRHGSSLRADVVRLVEQLNSGKVEFGTDDLGDVTSLEPGYSALARRDLAQVFGEAFASEIETLEAGQWSGPIISEFGLHLVVVDSVEPGLVPEFEKVRDLVIREVSYQRAEGVVGQIYQELAQRYTIIVGTAPDAAEAALQMAQNP